MSRAEGLPFAFTDFIGTDNNPLPQYQQLLNLNGAVPELLPLHESQRLTKPVQISSQDEYVYVLKKGFCSIGMTPVKTDYLVRNPGTIIGLDLYPVFIDETKDTEPVNVRYIKPLVPSHFHIIRLQNIIELIHVSDEQISPSLISLCFASLSQAYSGITANAELKNFYRLVDKIPALLLLFGDNPVPLTHETVAHILHVASRQNVTKCIDELGDDVVTGYRRLTINQENLWKRLHNSTFMRPSKDKANNP